MYSFLNHQLCCKKQVLIIIPCFDAESNNINFQADRRHSECQTNRGSWDDDALIADSSSSKQKQQHDANWIHCY